MPVAAKVCLAAANDPGIDMVAWASPMPPRTSALGDMSAFRVYLDTTDKPLVAFGRMIHQLSEQHVEAQGFSVVREFVGHGIGTALHEEPQVANYGPAGHGPRLSEGMVIAIEPMVNAGKPAVKVLSDGWTAVTKDKSLSAHFEHTVVVTRDGCEILTLLASEEARARQLLVAGRPEAEGVRAHT